MLEFIERQDTKNLRKHNWDNEFSRGVVSIPIAALYRVRNPHDNQLLPIEIESARTRLEDILVIYQDNYVEFLHKTNHENLFNGFGTHGHMAGLAIFSYDPNPSYDWMIWKEQSLAFLNNPKTKKFKGCLQAIAILCTYLEAIDKEDNQMNKVNELISHKKMGESLKEIENFVVDTICKTGNTYTGEESEKLLEKHIKQRKIRLPSRIEIACMLEVAWLFQNEGIIEKRNKWLGYVYGDSAQYPDFQKRVKDAIGCNEMLIEPQEILNVPPVTIESA